MANKEVQMEDISIEDTKKAHLPQKEMITMSDFHQFGSNVQ